MVAMFPPPFSSGERVLNLNIKQILEEKYDVDAINVSTGKLNPKKFGVAKVANQLLSLLLYCKAFIQIKKSLRTNNYHAFYFVTPSSSFSHIRDWIMVKIIHKRINNIYAFIQNGNYENVFQRKWHKRITQSFVSKVSKFIFTTNGLKQRVIKYIPEEKSGVISNSIDLAVTFTEAEISKKITNYNSPIKILYLSNMNPTKGYMDVAGAINILTKKMPELAIRTDFVGEWLLEEQLTEFRQFLKENQLEDIITIHGKINDRNKIKDFILNSSIFVLPTYFAQEAQPVSIIEALNGGTPVIATSHASIPEYITDGVNGFLVDKQSPEQIAEAIKKLTARNTWTIMAKAARKYFTENFSMDVYKKNIFLLFEGKK
jgi:glycosyltransferase involved in cell wall biosynthesis